MVACHGRKIFSIVNMQSGSGYPTLDASISLCRHIDRHAKHSSAIIAGSRYTYGELPDWTKEKRIYLPENAIEIDRFNMPRDRSVSFPLRVAFVGRLVPYKGADVLLDAIADFLRQGMLELHIIGDGPQRPLLQTMVERIGVHESVKFHGWVAHTDVPAKLRICDFLALPSIREFGGGVVVEAMALGVTPIVADYGGPSELVDGSCGIRVPFHDKASLVQGMKNAIGDVIRHPEKLDKLGAGGRRKVLEKLTWDAKANSNIRNLSGCTLRFQKSELSGFSVNELTNWYNSSIDLAYQDIHLPKSVYAVSGLDAFLPFPTGYRLGCSRRAIWQAQSGTDSWYLRPTDNVLAAILSMI